MNTVWKKFEETEVTHSIAHYLMAIHELLKEYGYARAIDVARYLNLTRGSVSITLGKIRDRGLISEDHNKFLRLTEEGERIVNAVLSQRRTLIRFFTDVLHLHPEKAEIDACKIEHLLSHETGERLMTFLGFYLSEALEAVKFRDSFEQFKFLCQSQPDCQVCELTCYFATHE